MGNKFLSWRKDPEPLPVDSQAASSPLVIVLFFIPVALAVALLIAKRTNLLSSEPLILKSLVIAIPVTVCFCFSANVRNVIQWLNQPGKRSVLIVFSLCWLAFLTTAIYDIAAWVNQTYDQSAPLVLPTKVIDKWAVHGRRGFDSYVLEVPLNLSKVIQYPVYVDHNTFLNAHMGDAVIVAVGNGYLGFPYVQKVDLGQP